MASIAKNRITTNAWPVRGKRCCVKRHYSGKKRLRDSLPNRLGSRNSFVRRSNFVTSAAAWPRQSSGVYGERERSSASFDGTLKFHVFGHWGGIGSLIGTIGWTALDQQRVDTWPIRQHGSLYSLQVGATGMHCASSMLMDEMPLCTDAVASTRWTRRRGPMAVGASTVNQNRSKSSLRGYGHRVCVSMR